VPFVLFFYANKYTHSALLFLKLQRYTVFDVYKSQISNFMYSFINNLLPDVFHNYFSLNVNFHGHNTRSVQNIHCNYARTNLRAAFIIHGPGTWNSIPVDIRNSICISVFKNKPKCWLLSFYDAHQL